MFLGEPKRNKKIARLRCLTGSIKKNLKDSFLKILNVLANRNTQSPFCLLLFFDHHSENVVMLFFLTLVS